jgi:hypothetical protein
MGISREGTTSGTSEGQFLKGNFNEENYMADYEHDTPPTGNILSWKDVDCDSMEALKCKKAIYSPDPDDLEPGQTIEDALKPYEDYLFLDSSPHVIELQTTDGTFLLVGENCDGHGYITSFKNARSQKGM